MPPGGGTGGGGMKLFEEGIIPGGGGTGARGPGAVGKDIGGASANS